MLCWWVMWQKKNRSGRATEMRRKECNKDNYEVWVYVRVIWSVRVEIRSAGVARRYRYISKIRISWKKFNIFLLNLKSEIHIFNRIITEWNRSRFYFSTLCGLQIMKPQKISDLEKVKVTVSHPNKWVHPKPAKVSCIFKRSQSGSLGLVHCILWSQHSSQSRTHASPCGQAFYGDASVSSRTWFLLVLKAALRVTWASITPE